MSIFLSNWNYRETIFGQSLFKRAGSIAFFAGVSLTRDDERPYLSLIETFHEDRIVYSRSLPFKTLEAAEADLFAQLTYLDSLTVDEFTRFAEVLNAWPEATGQPYRVTYHFAGVPKNKRQKVEGAEESGEFDTHEPDSVGDVLPKSHYLSNKHTAGMKNGYWINYRTGNQVEVGEHEDWLRNPANARTLGIPETVIATFSQFQPVADRDKFLRYVMQNAPIMRVRGHGQEISFEYHSSSSKAPLEAVSEVAQRVAGPFTGIYIANLATGETASMSYKDFTQILDRSGYEGVMRRAS